MQAYQYISIPAQRILNWKFSIINFFIILGLLKLTNLNFYLSQLLGFETEINNVGGGAFNFTNYIASLTLLFLIVAKVTHERYRWKSAWPLYTLIVVYLINGYLAPYTNYSWVLYQLIFLAVALLLHFVSFKSAEQLTQRIKKDLRGVYWIGVVFVSLMNVIVLSQYSMNEYLTEFNHAFVHALDDYGIMKQFYGYLLGFLLCYTIFILDRTWLKITLVLLLIYVGVGIRSMLLGIVGVGFIFTVRKPKWFLLYVISGALAFWLILFQYFELFIYDTRYYVYLNGIDIIQKFPFGLGLGGYPVYTEIYSRQLFSNFYNVQALLDYVPIAPESDLVHVFASLGLVLGGLHYLLIGRIIWYILKYLDRMTSGQKCLLGYFVFMTFYGIGDDSMFSINYWIFFGLASGIVAYLNANYKEEILIRAKEQHL